MFRQKFVYRQSAKIGWLFGLAVFLCLTVSAQSELQLNQPLEREIKKDETQIFKLNANSGDFVRVVVWQKNSDVRLKLFSAKGEKMVDVDNSDSAEEPERISFLADAAGEFRVEVVGGKTWQAPGNYEIKLDALRRQMPQTKAKSKPKDFIIKQF